MALETTILPVKLYGSRDSFLNNYTGIFPAQEIETQITDNATELRHHAACNIECSEQFRKGIIYGIHNRFASPYLAVDIAMIDRTNVLLGRKEGNDLWRFIGGFVDSSDDSMEAAARRELMEEASSKENGSGIYADGFKLIGETKIMDWRYKDDDENIFTALFVCNYISGVIVASDDMAELQWFSVFDLYKIAFTPEHRKLADILMKYLAKTLPSDAYNNIEQK